MRFLLLFCRIFVGSLFIVSGLIKANDPLGFSYKLEEYFAESALNLPAFAPWAMTLGVVACLAEVVLGFAVLFGGRMRLTSAALLVLTLFFGWLTAYTATCDPAGTYTVIVDGQSVERGVTCVTDCGCFGDAMKGSIGRSLTPWESFSKDMVLLVFIIPIAILAFTRRIPWNSAKDDAILLPIGAVFVGVWCWVFTWWGPLWFTLLGYAGYLLIKRFLQGPKAEWTAAAWIAVITLIFTWYGYAHLPMRDYRAYAVGKSIAEQKAGAKAAKTQIFLTYKNSVSGEQKEFPEANYPWDDSTWVYVDRRIVELEPAVESQVQDFALTDKDHVDITKDVLAEPGPVLLVMMYNVGKTDAAHLPAIKTLADEAFKNGWYVYGVSASPFEEIEEVRHENQLPFDFVQCDEKTIKTAVRANPGIMLLQQGTVRGLWHGNDTPTFEEVKVLVK